MSSSITQEYYKKLKMFSLKKREFKRMRVVFEYVKGGKVVRPLPLGSIRTVSEAVKRQMSA